MLAGKESCEALKSKPKAVLNRMKFTRKILFMEQGLYLRLALGSGFQPFASPLSLTPETLRYPPHAATTAQKQAE
jgi:hypothetical protein